MGRSKERAHVIRLRQGAAFLAAAITAATMASCAAGPRAAGSDTPAPPAQPTKEFRARHAEVLEHLGHVDAMASGLSQEPPEQQRRTMERIVGFFKDHIGPHASEEERILYPAVQRRAGEGNRLTEVPIYEHRIVERWTAELERESARPSPDAAAFAQRATHLAGLLRAHFEVEDQVLLPILDATMTSDEFKREIGDRMSH